MPYKSTTHKEKFFHFRHSPMLFKFYEPFTPQGGTVFCRQEDGTWYMALSLCSPSDQFCRARGRQEARRKYFGGPRSTDVPSFWGAEAPTYDDAKELYEREAEAFIMRRYHERHSSEAVQLPARVPRPKVRPRPAAAQPHKERSSGLHSLRPEEAYGSIEGVCGEVD